MLDPLLLGGVRKPWRVNALTVAGPYACTTALTSAVFATPSLSGRPPKDSKSISEVCRTAASRKLNLSQEQSSGEKENSASKEFIEMLLDGSILQRLKQDVPGVQVEDADEYLGYVNEYWQKYSNNSFALCKDYWLDITCIGVMAMESLINKTYPYLKLNDRLGFRLVDTSKSQVVTVNTYDELLQALNGSE